MAPQIFICYSSRDAATRDALREHSRQFQRYVGSFVDVEIAAGADWLSMIDEALRTAEVAVILVSHHLFASEFVMGTEIPVFMRRHQAGEMDVHVVEVSAHSAGEHAFGVDELGPWTLRRLQHLQREPPFATTVDRMSAADRDAFLEHQARALCKAALVRERMAALRHFTRAQVIEAWRTAPHLPRGRPEPKFPEDSRAALRIALDDLRDAPGDLQIERLQRFGDNLESPGPVDRRGADPDVRVVIRKRPDAPDRGWQVDVYGRSSHLETAVYDDRDLPGCLLDAGHFVGAPSSDVRIEVVVPLLERELPVDLWPVHEGFDVETPAGRLGQLTLRSLERVERPWLRDSLLRRTVGRALRADGFGEGGPHCPYAKVRIATDDAVRLLSGPAECAVLDHVPAHGAGRLDMLRLPLARGVATLLWCREAGRGEELAALAAPHAPAALPDRVLAARVADGIGEHLTLVVDDAAFELPISPLTSPTDEP